MLVGSDWAVLLVTMLWSSMKTVPSPASACLAGECGEEWCDPVAEGAFTGALCASVCCDQDASTSSTNESLSTLTD